MDVPQSDIAIILNMSSESKVPESKKVVRPPHPVEAAIRAAAAERIMCLDGAMGTMIQNRKLKEADFRGNYIPLLSNL